MFPPSLHVSILTQGNAGMVESLRIWPNAHFMDNIWCGLAEQLIMLFMNQLSRLRMDSAFRFSVIGSTISLASLWGGSDGRPRQPMNVQTNTHRPESTTTHACRDPPKKFARAIQPWNKHVKNNYNSTNTHAHGEKEQSIWLEAPAANKIFP